MILILTYHKVLRGPDPRPDFYTIRADQLERQLELLAQSGFHALSPEELTDYKPQPDPAYLLTFDDGTQDHYEVVLPMLARYHLRAIFFVPTSKLNRPGYLTTAQTREISRAGHVIGLHSHEHRRLDSMGEEDIRVQIEISQQNIGLITGNRPVFFAPPGGYFNRRVRDLALESGAQVVRTMRWGYNKQFDRANLECIPVNRYLTEWEFRRILKFRRSSFLYSAKQITKKFVPVRIYESLRTRLYSLLTRK
jgi:peptidoglycan/xylan/chitin deacetylase (PgdA/CDA1 family)